MQIKTTMRYHLTPVRMAHPLEWESLENLQKTNAGEGVEKREPSCTPGGMQIDTATMESSMEVP